MDTEKKQLELDKRYIRMASIWAENSYCQRRKVGALIVKDKMIISDGYNGTPSGFENVCEDENNLTKPYVLHAEANAITKIARSNNSSDGATMYVTASPCIECAKLIIQAGIKRVVYSEHYRLEDGIELLKRAGIEVIYTELDDNSSPNKSEDERFKKGIDMSTKNSSRFTPVIIAVSVVVGILIGTFYAKHFAGNRLGIINGSSNKLNALLRIVDDQYVDTVNMADLVEKAMPQILAELDPHSTYIPAQNLEEVNSELEGSFSGIGIQFTIQNDTIHVNAVVQGGPSEKIGLMAGDRIVTVDDSLFVGKKVTNERAMRTLKGPKGSQVKLGIKRTGEKDLLHFNITRGDIPQNTVDAAYMLNDDIGYVKVSKFGRTSHVELLNALAQLNHKKCKGLIIDLRDNTGGYMEAAIRMVNEFLPEGKLIVYTQGRKYPRAEEFANGTGSCQKMPLVVLINESSASASEIFTGAIQDNDRGTVVGRRSFGKGLVQQPIDFSDGSAIRLTIARYYTPSGRCIQRPYESGKDRNYELDIYNRYEHGEFFSRDSIKLNESERYNTSLGRTVYGGGGIMPDIFVPQDTTGVTSYLSTVISRGVNAQFAFQYTDNNRKKLSQYETEEELLNYLRHQGLVEQFVRFADSKGVKRRNILIQKSYKLLEKNLFGNIIYNMLGLEAYLQYFNKTDATVLKGIEILEKGEAFPKAPVAVEEEEVTKDKKDGKKKRTAQAYSITEDPTRGFNYAKAAIS